MQAMTLTLISLTFRPPNAMRLSRGEESERF